MLYSCSLEWVDVFRPLGVHMGPILQEQQWIKCFGVPSGSQHNGGYKYISLPWWQFWGLGTPKWTQNLVSTHSKLSRMVRLVPGGLSGPEIGPTRRPSWKFGPRSGPTPNNRLICSQSSLSAKLDVIEGKASAFVEKVNQIQTQSSIEYQLN